MFRCSLTRRAALSLSLLASAPIALAQTVSPPPRAFTAETLRGVLVVGVAPEVTLNGKPARLSPASRLRGTNNLILTPGAVSGQSLVVHYQRDLTGQLTDVWILTDAERANVPWPSTPQEAASWSFDAPMQVWRKR